MRKDVRIIIYRQAETIWSTWAEVGQLRPQAADVEDDLALPDVTLRLRFHYTRKLDAVLDNPTQYNVRVEQRRLPKPTIQSLTQSACGRYVTLEV